MKDNKNEELVARYPVAVFMQDICGMRKKLHLPPFKKRSANYYSTPIVDNMSLSFTLPEHPDNVFFRSPKPYVDEDGAPFETAYRVCYTQYGYDRDRRLIGYCWDHTKSLRLTDEFEHCIIPEK